MPEDPAVKEQRTQEEEHARGVKEKSAREAALPSELLSMIAAGWPRGADGNPMAIVIGQASNLVPTVPFGNVNIGPVAIMRPVPNHQDIDKLAEEAAEVQKATQSVVGQERTLIKWNMDPSTKPGPPSEM